MYHRFVRPPTDEEYHELERMTQQEVGRVAERARMVLLSARGFTVQRIMDVFEVVNETLYRWFDRFDDEGPDGLYDRPRSGRPPEIDAQAEQELARLLHDPPQEHGYDFTTWTTPLLKSYLEEHLDIEVSPSTVRRTLHQMDFVWRRPRWAITYKDPRYDERMEAIEAALVRAEQSEEVTVLFEDETDIRRLPPLRQMWMPRGEQARVPVPSSNAKFALYGVLDPHSGQTWTAPYPKGKSPYTEAFLAQVMARFKGQVLLIWDQASWHTSQAMKQVIAGYERLEVLLLPKRAPQQNPIEDVWRHLKRIVAANLERDLDVLKQACSRFFERLSGEDTLRMAGLAA